MLLNEEVKEWKDKYSTLLEKAQTEYPPPEKAKQGELKEEKPETCWKG